MERRSFLTRVLALKELDPKFLDVVEQWVGNGYHSELKRLLATKPPLEFQQVDYGDWLWRGHSVSKDDFDKLKKGGKLKIPPSSWSTEREIAEGFARPDQSITKSKVLHDRHKKFGLLIRYAPSNADVFLNIPMLTERVVDMEDAEERWEQIYNEKHYPNLVKGDT